MDKSLITITKPATGALKTFLKRGNLENCRNSRKFSWKQITQKLTESCHKKSKEIDDTSNERNNAKTNRDT